MERGPQPTEPNGIYMSKIFYPKTIFVMEDMAGLAIIMFPIPILLYSVILFLVEYGKVSIF